MTKYLIVNADDFGLCREITTGILRAYAEGIVTSTSVVVNGRFFREGLQPLKDSGIDAGIHLTFTGGESPVSGRVRGLVDGKGLFFGSYRNVIPRLMLGRFDPGALRKELEAQVSMLADSGIRISHMDSHQHLHVLPGVRDIVMDIARRFKIKWIRVPRSSGNGMKDRVMRRLGNTLRTQLADNGLRFTAGFRGFERGGHMNERVLSSILPGIADGVTELMVHPGLDASAWYDWGYAWEEELQALTAGRIKSLIRQEGIVLTTFKDVP